MIARADALVLRLRVLLSRPGIACAQIAIDDFFQGHDGTMFLSHHRLV